MWGESGEASGTEPWALQGTAVAKTRRNQHGGGGRGEENRPQNQEPGDRISQGPSGKRLLNAEGVSHSSAAEPLGQGPGD